MPVTASQGLEVEASPAPVSLQLAGKVRAHLLKHSSTITDTDDPWSKTRERHVRPWYAPPTNPRSVQDRYVWVLV